MGEAYIQTWTRKGLRYRTSWYWTFKAASQLPIPIAVTERVRSTTGTTQTDSVRGTIPKLSMTRSSTTKAIAKSTSMATMAAAGIMRRGKYTLVSSARLFTRLLLLPARDDEK